MKRPITNALATLMMVFIVATTAYAKELSSPHTFGIQSDGSTVDTCSVCHASALPTGAAANNVCLVCHKAGSAYSLTKQFFKGDMANPFGTTVEDDSNSNYSHSSHEWSATDDNPAAGALPPTNSAMKTVTAYNGLLSCNRCHSVHQLDSIPAAQKPLLRVQNSNNEMCLDCHRLRNTQSHLTGTHPVNINYTTVAKNNPAKFYPQPVNSNPNNPTAAMKLINGNILCTTCHGVHYTDSNSHTFDNRTTALTGRLAPSKGYLLRTDYRNYSSSLNSPNICTNCHANKFEHNGGNQRVVCTDCHSGHVDYDPNALTSQDRVPNIYMIKRYMNWSSPTGWKDNRKLATPKQTFYQDAGATTKLFKRADGKGVCQGCHDVPVAGLTSPNGNVYPDEHGTTNLVDAPASSCISCHNHDTPAPAGSFAASCTSCHGQPPTATSAAAGYTGNEAVSAHLRHTGNSYGCKECHYSGAPSDLHRNGSFKDVFTPYTSGMIARKFGASPQYNPDNTCSTVYCHSNGAVPPVYQTPPNWFGGNITTCDACHEASPTTNAHAKHIGAPNNYSCENCHAVTATGSTVIKDKTKHANGGKEVQFSSTALPFVNTGNFASETCSAVYCHSDGAGTYATPVWTNSSTGACGTCHATTTRATAAHEQHLSISVAYGPKLNNLPVAAACNSCHGPDYTANHINGSVQLVADTSCTASCHKNGLGTSTWTSGIRPTCESCHAGLLSVIDGKTAPDKGLFQTAGHGKNSSSTSVVMNYVCTSCHDSNAAHINPPVRDGRLQSNLTSSFNAQCNYCHNDSLKVTTLSKLNLPSHVLDKNASPTASSCSLCHDLHGSSNRSMIRDIINGQSVSFKNSTCVTTSPNANGVYAGLCQVCHTLTRFYKNSVAEGGHYTTGCLSCHKHTDNTNGQPADAAFYAFKPTGNCNDCHGYPPVQSLDGIAVQGNYSGARLNDYIGGGGAHSVAGHMPKTVKPADGWANCDKCHYGANDAIHMTRDYTKPSNIRVAVDPQYKFNAALQIRYSSNQVDPPLVNSTGTCSNVSCHFQPTPRWSTIR